MVQANTRNKIVTDRVHFNQRQPCPTRYEPEQVLYFQPAMSLKRWIDSKQVRSLIIPRMVINMDESRLRT